MTHSDLQKLVDAGVLSKKEIKSGDPDYFITNLGLKVTKALNLISDKDFGQIRVQLWLH